MSKNDKILSTYDNILFTIIGHKNFFKIKSLQINEGINFIFTFIFLKLQINLLFLIVK